jgi:uncharacterized protein (DUF362 family)
MHNCSRRDLLRRGVAAGLGICAPRLLTGCSAASVLPWPVPPSTPTDQTARVSAVKGRDLATMTRDAIDALGGMGQVVQRGETVFIKPNLGGLGLVKHNVFTSGDCTKTEVVAAVAEECLKVGAAQVIIGDGGQYPSFSWADVATLDGESSMAEIAQRLSANHAGDVTLACLNADSPEWDAVPSPYTSLGKIYTSSLVTRADRVISVPVVKTHRWTKMTGSLKNFIGATSIWHYGAGQPWRFGLHNAAGGIEQCFLDIAAAIKIDLAIIDASICCEGNGPHVLPDYWGQTVDMRERLGDWVVLASADPAAADATAARMIGHDVGSIKQLNTAYDMGLGQIHEDMIELVGARLDEIRVDFIPAEPTNGFTDVLIPGIMMMTEPERPPT